MPISANLQGFQQLANTDRRITQKGDGDSAQLVPGKSSRFGKSVAWVRTKLRPGSVAKENRQVMQSFIKSLTDSYGTGMGRVATRHLQADLDAGKRLSGTKIRATLAQVDAALSQRTGELNQSTIERHTKYDAADPAAVGTALRPD